MTHKIHKTIYAAALFALLVSSAHAKPQAKTKLLLKSQPIRLHPENPHYFLFRGKAVALITSGEHYGAVLNADFDYHKYLATLEADGLNYTRLFTGSYVEVPAKSFAILHNDLAPEPGRLLTPWARSETPGYASGGNKFDLAKWNPEYFARLLDFLSEAAKRGIVVEITLFSSHYGEPQWQVSPFNPANNINGMEGIDWKKLHTLENGNILAYQEKYARKLVSEANAFDNVILEIQNEPWSDRPILADVINPYLRPPARDNFPNSADLPDQLSLAWQTRVVEWITQTESALPIRHLIAQNYSNFRLPVNSLLPHVDVVNFHYAYPEAVLLNYGLGKAISYDETGFLGRDDVAYLREAWNFMLSGGSAFDGLDYSFTIGHEDGSYSEPNGPGGGSPAFRRQLRVLREFLQSFSLVDLRPDFLAVKQARGVTARSLSNPGKAYAIFLDGAGPTELTVTLPPGNYSAEWVDVSTGSIAQREAFSHKGGDKILPSPAFQKGIALRLKKMKLMERSRSLPATGAGKTG
ncbi:MAG TPA: hypothetical protein VMI32_00720 [Candidatus Solibacter sp.]|nr:hypothetical protein [Candidatus Solibacter sp.]